MRWSPGKGWWITQCFTAWGCTLAASTLPHIVAICKGVCPTLKNDKGFPQCWRKLLTCLTQPNPLASWASFIQCINSYEKITYSGASCAFANLWSFPTPNPTCCNSLGVPPSPRARRRQQHCCLEPWSSAMAEFPLVHGWWMCVQQADWAINLGIRQENFWGKLQRIKRKVTWNCKHHWHHRFSVAKSTTHLLLNMIGQWTFSAFFGGETVHRKPHWAPFPPTVPNQRHPHESPYKIASQATTLSSGWLKFSV